MTFIFDEVSSLVKHLTDANEPRCPEKLLGDEYDLQCEHSLGHIGYHSVMRLDSEIFLDEEYKVTKTREIKTITSWTKGPWIPYSCE